VDLFQGLLDSVAYFLQVDFAHDIKGVFRHIA
jgi:hypothetical protein